MEHARLSSLLVIALISLSQTETSSTLPETWYAANVINDGEYSPKPLTDIFSTPATFSSTNPIIVLSSSTITPDPIVSTSTLPNVTFSTSTLSTTPGTITEEPSTEVSVLALSTERPVEPAPVITVPTQPPPSPTVSISSTEASPSSQPAQPPQLPVLSVFQQPPAPPSPPPIQSTPQQIQIQTAQQSSPLPPQQIQNGPPIFFLQNQDSPQTIQNPQPQILPSISLPPLTTTTLPPSTTSPPLPSSSVSTQAPCATGAPVTVPQPSSQFPTFRIRMVAPSGSITNVRIGANPTVPTTTTRRPTTTRRRNRNNYDGCVNGCGGTRVPICASPLGETPVDPDALRGFPSVCHMACHNSFRKALYQKVADGKCGRLRTRIRPINENKLKRDELNKASYTIIQGGPTVVEFSPLNS